MLLQAPAAACPLPVSVLGQDFCPSAARADRWMHLSGVLFCGWCVSGVAQGDSGWHTLPCCLSPLLARRPDDHPRMPGLWLVLSLEHSAAMYSGSGGDAEALAQSQL